MKLVQRTRCAPLLREQRVSAASVGRGRGWGLFLSFLCSCTPPLTPPHKGGGERTEVVARAFATRTLDFHAVQQRLFSAGARVIVVDFIEQAAVLGFEWAMQHA